ncbi:helix-turn-helix domain-containing protein [Pseudohoeflea coraliihabitans]|uniref:Chromosomal replication initiator DnaA C-terminal domain-containing protein n=1 Tax=Pseudohoeflea coraliihabitans TaxID=2860393 RepID=A0ABS6WI77_9HYPH|nr:helix-turn-helix domain-containing protein [Pseudohoeflea sp. DP4N28-3]MBW3095656.1 hypothetical protein [Pseudohoeflea sp. DP4N28-3]
MEFTATDARDYRPGYNPEFLARAREKNKRREREKAARIHRELLAKAKEEARREREERARAEREQEAEQRRIEEATQIMAKAGNRYEPIIDITPQLMVKEIIVEVAERFGFAPREIVGRSRYKPLTRARQAAMAEVYLHRPDMSLPQIGRFFNRDHTTVLHALKVMGLK